jgi:hypothetical protein
MRAQWQLEVHTVAYVHKSGVQSKATGEESLVRLGYMSKATLTLHIKAFTLPKSLTARPGWDGLQVIMIHRVSWQLKITSVEVSWMQQYRRIS